MNNHWNDWQEQMRNDNRIWNRGFTIGVFSGAIITIISLAVLGWLLGIDG